MTLKFENINFTFVNNASAFRYFYSYGKMILYIFCVVNIIFNYLITLIKKE
jgi:hypothetical protein